MGRDVKRFANKTFLYTVDWALLTRFLRRHEGRIGLDLAAVAEDTQDSRARIFEYFTNANETYPSEMMEDLHRVSDLSSEVGMALLRQRAEELGVQLVPPEELEKGEGLHLSPRYLALRALLDHPRVFEGAADLLAFRDSPGPGEFAGEEEGVPPRLTEEAQRGFEQQAASFFNARYKGNYCRVRWYPDEDGLNLIVFHGKEPVTTVVVEDDEQMPLTLREMRQDTVTYDQHTGRAKVAASGEEEKRYLCDLFAATMLERPSFFQGHDSRNLYTLDRIVQEGPMFQLSGEWDPELVYATVTEIQVANDGSDGAGTWALTVRDSRDAVVQLFGQCPELDLSGPATRINYVKLRFQFMRNGKKRKRTVKIKPPSLASFSRSSLEAKVMEHLRRNGLCVPRQPTDASA